jgi:hypothetical protein
MSQPYEYVIVGHSDHTDDKFEIPRNVKLVFAAEEGQICHVPNNIDSILDEVKTIMPNKRVEGISNNYTISFNPNTTDGIYKLNVNENEYSLTPVIQYSQYNNEKNLQECINLIRDTLRGIIRPGDIITIYCIFCRGLNKEYFQSFGDNMDDTGLKWDDDDLMDLTSGGKRNKRNKKTKSIHKKSKTRKTRKSKTRKTRKSKTRKTRKSKTRKTRK